MKKRMLRLTSTSHDDGVPLLTCKGDESATLLQTAVGTCSSGPPASLGIDAMSHSDDRFRSGYYDILRKHPRKCVAVEKVMRWMRRL